MIEGGAVKSASLPKEPVSSARSANHVDSVEDVVRDSHTQLHPGFRSARVRSGHRRFWLCTDDEVKIEEIAVQLP